MNTARRRAAIPLAPPLRSRLGAYSASTMVTGALSIASSDAAVVYTTANQFFTDSVKNDGNFAVFNVDFNGDSVTDLRLWTRDMTATGTPSDNDALITGPVGLPGTVVGLLVSGYNYVSRLNAGAMIDGSAALISLGDPPAGNTVGWMADSNGFINSQWREVPNNTGYVGARFTIGSDAAHRQPSGWIWNQSAGYYPARVCLREHSQCWDWRGRPGADQSRTPRARQCGTRCAPPPPNRTPRLKRAGVPVAGSHGAR
jgi:hypothetical protein